LTTVNRRKHVLSTVPYRAKWPSSVVAAQQLQRQACFFLALGRIQRTDRSLGRSGRLLANESCASATFDRGQFKGGQALLLAFSTPPSRSRTFGLTCSRADDLSGFEGQSSATMMAAGTLDRTYAPMAIAEYAPHYPAFTAAQAPIRVGKCCFFH
jgi:hypothetical protein